MNTLLLIAIVLLLLWIVLVFDIQMPLWATYLMGIVILLLLFGWLVSIFRNGPWSGGDGRVL